MFKPNIILLIAKQTGLREEQIEKVLEIPPSFELGDYAFPCFILAGKFKKNPIEIAKELADKLSKKTADIEKIEASGPYLNFFINKQKLAEHILNINSSFGKQKQNQKIILEHTSVNPNASPHLGRTRNSIIGDSIYRMLSFLGNKVERHYYVNDVGKQIAMLALVFKERDKFDDLLKKYIQITKKIELNEIKGNDFVKEIVLSRPIKNSNSLKVDGVFVEIGHIPLSDLAVELGVKLNKNKEIIITREARTNVKGIYAAGDVADLKFKQAITGVGEAVTAIYSIYEDLKNGEIILC